jgi:hypothetical protein
MGNYYQTIADLDAEEHSAEASVDCVRKSLISRGIIAPRQTDCVLGHSNGHAPGDNYTAAVEEPCSHLFQLRTNGVAFIAKRSVFYSCGVGEITLLCSSCAKQSPVDSLWRNALDDWYTARGRGMLACVQCGIESPITEWQHAPPFAFGCLGIEFWNWPPLRQEFVQTIGQLLGHRLRLVYGK